MLYSLLYLLSCFNYCLRCIVIRNAYNGRMLKFMIFKKNFNFFIKLFLFLFLGNSWGLSFIYFIEYFRKKLFKNEDGEIVEFDLTTFGFKGCNWQVPSEPLNRVATVPVSTQ